ncbi:hypothetical protein [Campylobacter troglodytis]|uniref:hypothetical protein n=1 Tax=Campylobacter troglodytis TaxID=654363 RepID=UPI00115BC511|nr:hypothetical protein [Campylobacter troglodytis]TQR61064.1 hypothetical protein DMC01_02720 [Campylobacter troglodytis]
MEFYEGFYQIRHLNSKLNTKNAELSPASKQDAKQDFSELLSQEIEKKQEPKLSGVRYDDLQNGLLSREEYDALYFLDAAEMIVCVNLIQQKRGGDWFEICASTDMNSDPIGSRLIQQETIRNGTKAEKEYLIRSYMKIIDNNEVVPSSGMKGLRLAKDYLNKVLQGL